MDNPCPEDFLDAGALRAGLQKYLVAAMTVLAKRYPRQNDLPRREVRSYSRPSPGHLLPASRTEIYWRSVVRHSVMELDALPEAGELLALLTLEAHRALPLNRLVGTDLFGIRRIDAGTFMRAVLELALTAGDTMEHNEASIGGAIEQALSYLTGTTVPFQVLAPLQGFQCAVDKLRIDGDLSIVRLNDEDWEWLDPTNHLVDSLTVGQEEFGLLRRIELPKRLDSLNQTASLPEYDRRVLNEFESAVSCLRMFKRGAVGFTYYRWGPAEWNPTPASVGRTLSAPGRLLGSPYVITEADASTLELFAREHGTKTRQHGRLAVALRWFNSSYERLRVEERLVDYAIALEALVGDSAGDIAYRLSARTAALVGVSLEAREEISTLVKDLYKVRSQVVHGQPVKSVIQKLRHNHELGTFVDRCEDLVRDALRAHCRECPPGQEEHFPKMLDRRMLGFAGP